ncbi:MAG: ECF-type sigma factor [Acidobacteriota bacterium]
MTEAPPKTSSQTTAWFRAWREGDAASLGLLTEAVYSELRQLAFRKLGRESAGHTLQPTDLVHEVYLRLAHSDIPWQDRAHFLAIVATTMRRVLIDHARSKRRAKRGDGAVRVTLSNVVDDQARPEVDMLDLDQALHKLSQLDARQAKMVELRYFAGMTLEEIAAVTGVSIASTHRQLRSARAWMRQHFEHEPGGDTRSE